MPNRKPVIPNHTAQIEGRESADDPPNRETSRDEHWAQPQRRVCNSAYGTYLIRIRRLGEKYGFA